MHQEKLVTQSYGSLELKLQGKVFYLLEVLDVVLLKEPLNVVLYFNNRSLQSTSKQNNGCQFDALEQNYAMYRTCRRCCRWPIDYMVRCE